MQQRHLHPALARDLGDSLESAATTALRRTEAAGISVTACPALAEVEAQPELIPPGRLVRRWLPFVTLPAAEVLDLSHGRSVPAAAEPTPPTGLNRLVGSMTHSRPSGAAQSPWHCWMPPANWWRSGVGGTIAGFPRWC